MKRLFSIFLTVALLACTAVLPVNAAGSVGPIENGVTWVFDRDTGVLTMTGAGVIPDYLVVEEESIVSGSEKQETQDNRPWGAYAGQVTEVVLSDDITYIGDYAFYGFEALTEINMPEKLTAIGDFALTQSSITEITLPDDVTAIGDYAFYNTDLSALALPEGVSSVGAFAFAKTPVKSVIFPTTLVTMGEAAFGGCAELVSVMLPNSLTVLADFSFANCSALSSVILPGGLTAIGESALSGCVSLNSLMIPDSVTAIGGHAFEGCAGIKELRLPTALTELGSAALGDGVTRLVVPDTATGITGLSLANASSLESLVISPSHPAYTLEDDILWNKDQTELIAYMGEGVSDLVIPEGVTAIGAAAFFEHDEIKAIVLPDSLVTVGAAAFARTGVSALAFPATLQSIGDNAFRESEALTVILIPGTQTAVGEYAFMGATAKIYAQPESEVHKLLAEAELLDQYVAIDNDLGFLDVTANKWSYEGIEYAVRAGLFNGTGIMTFEPEARMTRAMLVSVLYRMAGSPALEDDAVETPDADQPVPAEESGEVGDAESEVTFTDIAEGRYYYNAVLWAKENGIVNGTTASTFSPNAPVTREQMASILHRYAYLIEKGEGAQGALTAFEDADQVSNYAKEDLAWAVGAGLITGTNYYGTILLNPKGEATRAQVATILMRFATMEETPVDPEEPTDPETPVDPEEPTDPETPVDPEEPTDPETPVDPEEPTDPETPVDPEEPTDPETPVE